MLKKEDIKSIIKIGITLFLITAISAFILALVNEITSPVIASNRAKKQAEAMQVVLPDAKEFSDENLAGADADEAIDSVFEGKDDKGETAGYAVMVKSVGYGGEILLAVGIDNECKITGIDVITQAETAGLGAKCTEDEFKSQFKGKTSPIEVVKRDSKENQIDAISSATITSKAVTKGVNIAVDTIKEMKGEN